MAQFLQTSAAKKNCLAFAAAGEVAKRSSDYLIRAIVPLSRPWVDYRSAPIYTRHAAGGRSLWHFPRPLAAHLNPSRLLLHVAASLRARRCRDRADNSCTHGPAPANPRPSPGFATSRTASTTSGGHELCVPYPGHGVEELQRLQSSSLPALSLPARWIGGALLSRIGLPCSNGDGRRGNLM